MRLFLTALASLLFAASALAAEGQPGSSPPPPPPPLPPPGAAAAMDPLAGDVVLCRLEISAEQAPKIREICADHEKKFLAAVKEAETKKGGGALDDEEWIKISEQTMPLLLERNKKIRELLSADAQAKFDAGVKLVLQMEAESNKIMREAIAEIKAAGDDEDKKTEIVKQLEKKSRTRGAEFQKQLDEQVGKPKTPPKPQK